MIAVTAGAIAPIMDRIDFAAIRFALAHDEDPIRAFEIASERGSVVKIPPDQVIISDPEIAAMVLADGKRFPRDRGTELFRKALGPGALTADEPHWKAMRQRVQPVLQRAIKDRSAVVQEAEILCDRWDKLQASTGALIDTYPEMAKFTLGVMGSTLFGIRLDPFLDALVMAMKVLERQFINLATEEQFQTLMPRMDRLLKDARPMQVPEVGVFTQLAEAVQGAVSALTVETTFVGLEGLRSWMTRGLDQPSVDMGVEILDCVARYMINRAKCGQLDSNDNFLTRLLAAQQSDSLTEQDVRDQILNVLLAGSGTTATALATLLYYVLTYPAFIPLLRQEATAALEQCGNLENPDIDTRLILNTALQYEVLRLLPPTRQVARTATESMKLGGVEVEPRDLLVINILGIHRKRSLWPEWADPRKFEPSHWIGAAPQDRPAFMPFGVGPHRCPGYYHAAMYARILLTVLLQRYDLEFAVQDSELVLKPGSTIQIGPLLVNARSRTKAP